MKGKNFKSDGTPRLGRPTGPTKGRGQRPWDEVDLLVLKVVAANPDLERWRIANALEISPARLSNITCSPEGAKILAALAGNAEDLPNYRLNSGS